MVASDLAGSGWRLPPSSFKDPDEVFVAVTAAEVPNALAAAESAAMSGRWVVGMVGYDAGVDGLPLAWFGVYHQPVPLQPRDGDYRLGDLRPAMTRWEHLAAVGAIKERIAAGDTYQVNLTFPMVTEIDGSAACLFGDMVAAQPRCYGAYLDLGAVEVLSASPELFLSRFGEILTSKPMKGTAPRGRFGTEDDQARLGLVESEKERAGNVMIVDMVRNDLGRLAETGTVVVPELYAVERHPTVWQMTSTVTASMPPEVGLAALFEACFPCGSVTGAPKQSTMSIITAVEAQLRGVYCGAIGYLAPGGDFEFNVAIRTATAIGGNLRYGVGGGITFDSDPEAEYRECLWKARLLTAPPVTPTLVETMRMEKGEIALIDRHLARLYDSARYWAIPLDLERVQATLQDLDGNWLIRLTVGPAGAMDVERRRLPDPRGTVRLRLATDPIDSSESHWFHKTADRSRYPPPVDCDEVVLWNERGEVTETGLSNIMVRLDGVWTTPPLDSGCLPGVFRALLLEKKKVVERVVTLDEVRTADDLAVTNAVRGWRGALLIE